MSPKEVTELVTAIAALIGVLAWPVAFASILFLLRKELKQIAVKIPSALDRVQTVKIGAVVAQLKELADKAVVNDGEGGDVTAEQVHVAVNLQVQADLIGKGKLLAQMDRLSIEYDTIRRAMSGGSKRTSQMTKILVQMRGLGRSVSDHIDVYKSSGSAGSRLAAIAMMQMEPQKADIPWLIERFKSEAPFVFYHAALALQNSANSATALERDSVIEAAKSALRVINSFSGIPDPNTIHVLESLLK